MQRIDLNGPWQLRYAPLDWNGCEGAQRLGEGEAYHEGHGEKPTARTLVSPWFNAELPCDVHTPLIEAGIISEPLDGLNSFDCEWIEGKSWWFKRGIAVDTDLLAHERIDLVLEYLDLEAEVFLNGRLLGLHRSVHVPFEFDLRPLLREGANELLVRVSVGLERVSDLAASPYAPTVNMPLGRGDPRRVFLRKPQYVFGWDWGPRAASCGICGDAYLRVYDGCFVSSLDFRTDWLFRLADGSWDAHVSITLELTNPDPFATRGAGLSLTLSKAGREELRLEKSCLLRSGVNFVDLSATLHGAEPWWPNGMGAQTLYELRASVWGAEGGSEYGPVKVGVRTLSLDTEALGEDERLFALVVNGIKVFCKGASWIPADALYARVTADKYRTLLEEAQGANFTMLRIWGGGIYEKDLFYQACDEMGLLVWQDFMFACASYPDTDGAFMDLVRRELSYQIRRLRSHPALALWCGNNENQWIYGTEWKSLIERFGGSRIYDALAPELVRLLSPAIPYWNSSPYGGLEPNAASCGDRHHWHDCTMHPEMERRITPEEYDGVDAKFISEYGYIGPCSMETIHRYHGGAPVERFSALWNHHNNTFEKDTVVAGIRKHYVDPEDLSLDEYLLYAGLCQAQMYGYSLESFRTKPHCWGGLFWMYDDCWGEVGWTIIDYYLDRKPSYYAVKRAFAPRKLILRECDGSIAITGINEGSAACEFDLEYGYCSFDGQERRSERLSVCLEPRSRDTVHTFPKPKEDLLRGFVFAAPIPGAGDTPSWAFLRSGPYRTLAVPTAHPQIVAFENHGHGEVSLVVRSASYAHAVHLRGNVARPSDDYFDLLPGRDHLVRLGGCPPSLRLDDLVLDWVNKAF